VKSAEHASPPASEPSLLPLGLKLSLFWRTFFLLALLILFSSLAWLQMFRIQEVEPRILRNAHQIATVVNLTKTALRNSDEIGRVALLKILADEEDLSILIREPNDKVTLFGESAIEGRLAHEMVKRLGPDTVIASWVNGEPGLWVGFRIARDSYWLQMDPDRIRPLGDSAWLTWLAIILALSLAGAALMAGLINRPLKRLSFAASQVREGHFTSSTLDEQAATSEIREVNIGFNRMAERLAKIEYERTLMLAGISHDLRTPLARLRLETELSVPDLEARGLMAADIAQLDAIIGKFLDYARPEPTELGPVLLSGVISRSIGPWRNNPRFEITVNVDEALHVKAEAVELGRVLSNLLENARRYGQSPNDGITRVQMDAHAQDGWVLLRVCDQGPGVSDSALRNLTQPFFRGDAARTSATGSGLGLAIVERSVQRMGGTFSVSNGTEGGLIALVKFRQWLESDGRHTG
jgi:two-component system, OmpR family, osmolarity sensor histidine kinase EnvZ